MYHAYTQESIVEESMEEECETYSCEEYISSGEEEAKSMRNTVDLSAWNGREWVKNAATPEEFLKICAARLRISSKNKMLVPFSFNEELKSPRRSVYGQMWQQILTEANVNLTE